MRIAVFTNQFPARINTFFARDLRSLVDAGWSVEVFVLYPETASFWRFVPPYLGPDLLPRDAVHHPRWRASLAALRSPPSRTARWLGDAAAVLRATLPYGPMPVAKSAIAAVEAWTWAAAPRPVGFDHVLAYWGNYAASCAYLFHRATHPHVPFSMFAHARVDLYRHPAFLAQKFAYADNIFLVCEYNRRFIATRYPDLFPRIAPHIHIHHLGVDLSEYQFVPDGRPRDRLLVATRFEHHKGVHVILDAMALLRDRGVAAELDIVGGGEEAGGLQTQVRALGLGDRVRFRGWLSADETRRAMAATTLLVHAPLEQDAMPTVLKEALALGTPVVASDSAGIPEILAEGRCGALVPPGNPVALAAAIEALLADPARRRAYADAGRRQAERLFDLAANGRAFAERLRSTRRPSQAPPAREVRSA